MPPGGGGGFLLLSAALSAAAFAATGPLLAALLPNMAAAGFVAVNFRGRPLPSAGGIAPVLAGGGALLLWLGAAGRWPPSVPAAGGGLALAFFGFALVGFVDDAFGDRSAGGFLGHGRRLLRGELTTGGVKAIFGTAAALAAAATMAPAAGGGLLNGLLNAFLIAGFANGVNLLDVRPGRALKLFFGLGVLLFAAAPGHPGWLAVLPPAAAFAAFLPADLGGRTMLGDGGANAAGALLGGAAAMTAGAEVKLTLAAAVAALHLFAERGSVSDVVASVPWLRRLDEWGRGDGGPPEGDGR